MTNDKCRIHLISGNGIRHNQLALTVRRTESHAAHRHAPQLESWDDHTLHRPSPRRHLYPGDLAFRVQLSWRRQG